MTFEFSLKSTTFSPRVRDYNPSEEFHSPMVRDYNPSEEFHSPRVRDYNPRKGGLAFKIECYAALSWGKRGDNITRK